MLQLLGGSNLL
jgi:hypothetical protein